MIHVPKEFQQYRVRRFEGWCCNPGDKKEAPSGSDKVWAIFTQDARPITPALVAFGKCGSSLQYTVLNKGEPVNVEQRIVEKKKGGYTSIPPRCARREENAPGDRSDAILARWTGIEYDSHQRPMSTTVTLRKGPRKNPSIDINSMKSKIYDGFKRLPQTILDGEKFERIAIYYFTHGSHQGGPRARFKTQYVLFMKNEAQADNLEAMLKSISRTAR
jgi:hypothetical protein